jgi:hypothetical protein
MDISKLFNSNREGHLFAASVVGLGLAAASWRMIDGELLRYSATMTGILVPLWELFATPDMDHSSRKMGGTLFRCLWVLFWGPYRALVPHRSRWSHSLLIGTPARMLYVWGVPLLLTRQWWQGVDVSMLVALSPFVIAPFVADTVHLLKDGYYSPLDMLLGRV